MTSEAQRSHATWEDAVQWLRTQPDQRELVLGSYYDDPLIEAAARYWRSDEWQAMRAWLPAAPAKALDVGAGRGIASYAFARDGYDVTALEPDSSALVGARAIRSLASEAGLSIRVEQEFSERLPFADGAFDVVFARAVLHHTRDLDDACREFMRVLKPGGLLLAVREHVISRPEDLPAFLDIHPLHRHYGGENAFLLQRYQQAISDAGFRLLRTLAPLESPINYAPYDLRHLQRLIADRVAAKLPPAGPLVAGLLRVPGVWRLLWPMLQRVDHRPGRLYSFIARKP